MKRILISSLTFAALALGAGRARACASCGSGGDDPLILYPNESLKFYLGLSQLSDFHNVDPDGSLSTAGGPSSKETLTLSGGYAISPRAFVTLTAPYIRNSLDGDSRSAFGDPSLAGRYSVVMQSLAQPWVPQVQLIAGYKHAQARSLRESNEMKTLIDVFGNGFSEAKMGVDVWYGMAAVKFGAAHTVSKPLKRDFDDVTYEPGLVQRSTTSLGYLWAESWKTTIGMSRELRGALKVDGASQPNSQQQNNSAFLNLDVMTSALDSVRLSYARQAFAFRNQNTTSSRSVSMAYMRTL